MRIVQLLILLAPLAVAACEDAQSAPPDELTIIVQGDRRELEQLTVTGHTELVVAARATRPGLRVLFMSGYSHEVLAPEALAEQKDSSFIEKPFNAGELLRAIRALLDGPPDARRP